MKASCLKTTVAPWLLILTFASPSFGAPISSLNDIEFWIGNGTNRAALLLDWDGEAAGDQSLAWGYRWDGAATGEDMLRDVLAADGRLFAKIGAVGPAGIAFYGAGYDLNGDGQFAIDDGTTFDVDGIAVSGPADLAMSVDPGDLYAEGWFLGFWMLGQSSTNPFGGGAWAQAGSGLSGLSLTDGLWTSLAFTGNTFSTTAFAQNPVAAVSTTPNADFNADGDVDGIDFLAWQRGFGIAAGGTLGQGDANHNGSVDGIDFSLWEAEFGLPAGGAVMSSATFPLPEPSCLGLAVLAAYALLTRRTYFFRFA